MVLRKLPSALLLVVAACAPPEPTADSCPNVLLVVLDDLSDWVGCLGGHPDARTPNIDRLAERGVLFTNAHAQAPLCNPSRTSFFLGLRPSTTGVYGAEPWFREVPELADRRTLPQSFADHGYRTLAAGKVFHASAADPASFQVEGPAPGQTSPLDRRVLTPRKMGMWDFGPQTYDESKTVDAEVVSWAIARLGDADERPFFLTVGLHRPHVPMYAPARFFELVPERPALTELPADDLDDVPGAALAAALDASAPADAWFATGDRRTAVTRAYLAATAFVDAEIGRLLDALAASAHADDTIVVLLSDHGFHLGEKSVWGKRTLWERSTHVPLIVSAPGGRRGARSSRTVELLDLFPTLAELCGLEPPAGLDGASLVPLLDDPNAPFDRPALTSLDAGSHAVRTERWRYIRYRDGSEELYDHASDPHEWTNLAGDPQHTATRTELARLLPANAAPDAAERAGR
jgi:arylsulfatase A-like enzyme